MSRSPRQISTNHPKCRYLHEGGSLRVDRMKMRWRVVVAIHANNDPVEAAELGHDETELISAHQIGPRFRVQVFEALAGEVQVHGQWVEFERIVLAPGNSPVGPHMCGLEEGRV